MGEYLVAEWDYEAEGQQELSFVQGQRILLLERRNSDWWEGELDGVVGFFPANRTRIESEVVSRNVEIEKTSPPPRPSLESLNGSFTSDFARTYPPTKSIEVDPISVDYFHQTYSPPASDQIVPTDDDPCDRSYDLIDRAEIDDASEALALPIPSRPVLQDTHSLPPPLTEAHAEPPYGTLEQAGESISQYREPNNAQFELEAKVAQVASPPVPAIAIDPSEELIDSLGVQNDDAASPADDAVRPRERSEELIARRKIDNRRSGAYFEPSSGAYDVELVKAEVVMSGVSPEEAAIVEPTRRMMQEEKDHLEKNLPFGWRVAHDDEGTIYYFNEFTGETRWDVPGTPPVEELTDTLTGDEVDQVDQVADANDVTLPAVAEEASYVTGRPRKHEVGELDSSKLQLDQLRPEWIRRQAFGQIKMKTGSGRDDSGSRLASWKMYWCVLSCGFLIFYREALPKGGKKSIKPLLPLGCFDLDACRVEPATRHDTKRKFSFVLTTPRGARVFVQLQNERELADWLDTVMRDIVARKEQEIAPGIEGLVRLLKRQAAEYESEMAALPAVATSAGNKGSLGIRKEEVSEPVTTRAPATATKKRGGWFSKGSGDRGYHNRPASMSAAPAVAERAAALAQREAEVASDDAVFGGYLRCAPDRTVPYIVELCVTEVEARGIDSVGIYRLSGSTTSIQRFRTQFNIDEFSVSFADEHDVNVITGLLKLYLRELRDPLMTYELYNAFIESARESSYIFNVLCVYLLGIPDYDTRMYQVKSLIDHALPPTHRATLEYLMRHLQRVAAEGSVNKMESSNLALIFSVGLLRPQHEDIQSIVNTSLQSKIIEAIIQQVDWFFDAPIERVEEQEPETVMSEEGERVMEESVMMASREDRPEEEKEDGVVEVEAQQEDARRVKQKPIVGKHEPVVEKQEPAVKKQEPVVEKQEPMVKKQEPVTVKQEPVVKKQESVVEKQEPMAEKQELVMEKQDPAVEKQEPIVEKQESVVEKQEPMTEKQECEGELERVQKHELVEARQEVWNGGEYDWEEKDIRVKEAPAEEHIQVLTSTIEEQTV